MDVEERTLFQILQALVFNDLAISEAICGAWGENTSSPPIEDLYRLVSRRREAQHFLSRATEGTSQVKGALKAEGLGSPSRTTEIHHCAFRLWQS